LEKRIFFLILVKILLSMKYGKWVRNLTFVAAFGALCFQSCRKENGIDNNNVIRTPYSLYFGDSEGGVEKTNDGVNYKRIFPYDGIPVRAFATSGTNLLFIKRNAHLSEDNGENFNPTDLSVNPLSLYQSVIIRVENHDRLYLASLAGRGILYSENDGKTWKQDNNWDTTITGFTNPNSFAQLKDGDLFAYTDFGGRLFKRTGKDDRWVEVTTNGLSPTSGYFLSRLNNALIASNVSGGIYYSLDRGANWFPYGGLPATESVYATYAPFDQTLLAGTENGIYRLQSGNFVLSNNGLAANTAVYSITAKSDTYKNEVVKQYVFIGTSTGLYRSDDLGQNWILVKEGDIRRVY
jgi:hypothetical protein